MGAVVRSGAAAVAVVPVVSPEAALLGASPVVILLRAFPVAIRPEVLPAVIPPEGFPAAVSQAAMAGVAEVVENLR